MENLVKLLPVIAVVALVVIIFLLGYVKAPPDVAYIISGIRKKPRVLIGRAGIRIPFLERVDKLIVRQISIDIKSEGYIPTNDFIGVDVDAVAKVRVKTDPEGIQLAMKNSRAICAKSSAPSLSRKSAMTERNSVTRYSQKHRQI